MMPDAERYADALQESFEEMAAATGARVGRKRR
jgi:hypothetical protein